MWKELSRAPNQLYIKNARSRSRPSASFQVQPPWENLPTVKSMIPQVSVMSTMSLILSLWRSHAILHHHWAKIASLTTCTSMYYYNYWWTINALKLWQIFIQHSLNAIEIPRPHSLNDCQMERSFDLPQYVETTLQFPSAFECASLSIPALTLEMLLWYKPVLPCNTNMSDQLAS